MDNFSSDSDLANIHTAFHQGQYREVVDYDTSALSSEDQLSARVLQLRAKIVLGDAEKVLAEIESESSPEMGAVKALAQLELGNPHDAVSAIEKLAQDHDSNVIVQILGGTVLHAAGKSDEALNLLSKHQGSLDAVAMITQIHLQQNRADLAAKEVAAARRWAQDSLLVNLAEAWVGMRVGGEKYQQSFYVFEELAQASATSSVVSLVSQAVSEIHLARIEEAAAALAEALKKDPKYPEVLSNNIVLSLLSGQNPKEHIEKLKATSPHHLFLQDFEEKSLSFDKAAAKYHAKVQS